MAEKVIYLAGGCFWGVSEYYSRIRGLTALCGNRSVVNYSAA
ncbi:MAG: peptide-methionine (S)-S-oxide reductase [Succinivibrio sp.]|nr:peptide-methionine (S)-S-oxide reductase [Succinivibrio sp.]